MVYCIPGTTSHSFSLLYGDGQIHILVNGAIQLECSGGGKRSNILAITTIEGHIDSGRPWLFARLWSPVHPHPVVDNMLNLQVVNKRKF